MIRIISLCFLLNSISTFCLGQMFELRGIVIDSVTALPVPYASVGISKSGIGTITNQEGKFLLKIPQSAAGHTIEIQMIGYKTYSFTSRSAQNIRITCKLTPSPKELNEVIVMPRDTLLQLLRMAFKAIPKNYPNKPLMYNGFFREVQKANDTLYLNFTEAVLDVYKQGYDNNSNFGQIKINKSRKNNFPGTDTINNVRFYGGPHIAHSCDFVFKRSDFINPRNFRNYSYWLAARQKVDEIEVYSIGFKHNNDSIIGTLYLNRNSLAYIGLELYVKRDKVKLLKFYKYKDASEKVRYTEYQGKWHLNYVIINTSGINTALNKKVDHHLIYVTSSIKTDSIKPIPFNEEFAYTDVISISAENYSQTSWKDYNILENDSSLSAQQTFNDEESREILAKNYAVQKTRREKLYEIAKHFTFNYGLQYLPANNLNGKYQFTLYENNISVLNVEKELPSSSFTIAFYSKIAYTFRKHFGVYYSSIDALEPSLQFKTWDIGVQYGAPVFRNSRKWFADFSLGYSHTAYYYKMGNAENKTNKIIISNKTFDAKKIGVFTGTRYSSINPSLTITYKVRRITSLFLTTTRELRLNSEDIAILKEKSGFFLTRKSQRMQLSNNQIQLSIDGETKTTSVFYVQPFAVAFGLAIKF